MIYLFTLKECDKSRRITLLFQLETNKVFPFGSVVTGSMLIFLRTLTRLPTVLPSNTNTFHTVLVKGSPL